MENYTEGNRIIHEWMGKEYFKAMDDGRYKDARTGDLLDYHNNWTSLMEVVERIIAQGFWVEILLGKGNACEIGFIGSEGFFMREEKQKPHDAVYTAVLSFINWHNKQLKTEE